MGFLCSLSFLFINVIEINAELFKKNFLFKDGVSFQEKDLLRWF